MDFTWSTHMPVMQVRIARPTDQMEEIELFYCVGLGLQKIGSFTKHSGYDGIMIGLPGYNYHLEFTTHEDGSPCLAPTKDNLLVFYIPDAKLIQTIAERLNDMGYPAVSPENPYWEEHGVTIEDPDGWRIVLMNSYGIGPKENE
ncbi:VOC family protein [Bacillus manliponensis]|uniref:VOC family protein n=1 Tax=Bacillus manliponensis TaxID=574376 RepID=UPI003513FCE0